MSREITAAEDYSSARTRFLDAANACNAKLESFRNHDAEADDTGLFMDVVTVGCEEADKFVVVSSGVHGVEGFAGSAVQTALLENNILTHLPDNTCMMLVYAVNPYGFAHLRRVNEQNVDLNRNFIDFDKPLPKNPNYDQLADVIAPLKSTIYSKIKMAARLYLYRFLHGRAGLQKAVTQGQYSHPDGLFFGGKAPSWSRLTLEQVARDKLSQAKRVIWIDLHTGLGPYAQGELIMYEPDGSETMRRAQKWWGHDRVRSAVSGDSVSADLNGTLNRSMAVVLVNTEVTAAGLEFGTFAPMSVFRAMQVENRLTHAEKRDPEGLQKAREDLLRMFAPHDEDWLQRVWRQSLRVVEDAFDALR